MKISIVTPSYNQGCFLQRTLDSILSQSGDFEVEAIVMDGGSTDETVEVLQSYGDAVHWVSEPDQGQADALNKGLRIATGDVIGWLNSDDVYEPGCLQTVCKIFRDEPETRWLYGKVRIIDEDDREFRRWITWYKNFRMNPFRYSKLLSENWISQMGVFWRQEVGEEVGLPRVELQHAMDYEYWLRLGARWPGRFVDQYLASFRWYTNSKTGGDFITGTRECLDIAIEYGAQQFPLAVLCHRFNRAKIVGTYQLMHWLRK